MDCPSHNFLSCDHQVDTIFELLKNAILVMHSAGHFLPGSRLWETSWVKINPVIPSLQVDLFPDLPSVTVSGLAVVSTKIPDSPAPPASLEGVPTTPSEQLESSSEVLTI